MATIDQISEGQLVTCDGEYAAKKYCIHNNPYYAYVGSEDDALRADYTQDDIDNSPTVSDWDEVDVSACCG